MRQNTSTAQLDLLFSHNDKTLKQYFEERLTKPISLLLTENSTTVLSARVKGGVLHVRLHRMFLQADDRVLSEIASYLKGKRGAMPCFRSFVRDHSEQLNRKPPKKILLRTA